MEMVRATTSSTSRRPGNGRSTVSAESASGPPTTGPSITLERTPGSLTLNAWVPRALLPVRPTAIGLTAVIETRNGDVSHWALHHPRADRPDFHHPAGWTHRPDLPSFPNATPSA
jgi:hypothetical protein